MPAGPSNRNPAKAPREPVAIVAMVHITKRRRIRSINPISNLRQAGCVLTAANVSTSQSAASVSRLRPHFGQLSRAYTTAVQPNAKRFFDCHPAYFGLPLCPHFAQVSSTSQPCWSFRRSLYLSPKDTFAAPGPDSRKPGPTLRAPRLRQPLAIVPALAMPRFKRETDRANKGVGSLFSGKRELGEEAARDHVLGNH